VRALPRGRPRELQALHAPARHLRGPQLASIAVIMKAKLDRDSRIQDAVIAALKTDDRVRAPDIGVEVHEGIVTLSGAVQTWGARTAAQEIAHRVSDARDVVNDILVVQHAGAHPADLEVANAVRAALDAATPTLSRAIDSSVTRGIVTLEGVVTSTRDRDLLVRAASAAPGVTRVQDWIVVRTSERPDAALAKEVARALARHAEHVAKHVTITIDGDVIKLTGTVRSEPERDAVVGAAKGVSGHRLIDSRDLHVVAAR
jgi:osmotically-inducible protein OsmY